MAITITDVIYQLFIDRFAGADATKENKATYAGGTISSITKQIDYFTTLGVTALWLNPFVQ